MELHNVEINPGAGPAFLIRKSTGLEIDAIQSRVPGNAPVLRLDDCPNAIIRDSRAWPGTDVFLSTDPGAKYILHEKDQLSATKPTEEKMEDFWKGINSPDRPTKK